MTKREWLIKHGYEKIDNSGLYGKIPKDSDCLWYIDLKTNEHNLAYFCKKQKEILEKEYAKLEADFEQMLKECEQ